MAGILPDWLTIGGSGGGLVADTLAAREAAAPPPSWFAPTIANLQQGGSPLLTSEPFGRFPMQLAPAPQQQRPEQIQSTPAAQPTIGTIAQSSGGVMAREDGGERSYAPSAFNNFPVPSLPTLAGIGDRLNAGLMGFAHGGALLPAFANLVSGLATGQRADPQGVAQAQQDRAQRAAAQYIAGAQDIEPNLKAAMVANPALAAQYFLTRAKPPVVPLAPRLRSR